MNARIENGILCYSLENILSNVCNVMCVLLHCDHIKFKYSVRLTNIISHSRNGNATNRIAKLQYTKQINM